MGRQPGFPSARRLDFATLPFVDRWKAGYWDGTNPAFISHDPRERAPPWRYWWANNQNEVSWDVSGYPSRWLPVSFLDQSNRLADLMFDAAALTIDASRSQRMYPGVPGFEADWQNQFRGPNHQRLLTIKRTSTPECCSRPTTLSAAIRDGG